MLVGDYTDDEEMQRFFAELADGLQDDRLRSWVGSDRDDELDDRAEVLLVDLGRYVEELLVGRLSRESIERVGAHLEACLSLLRDLSRAGSARLARAAVDAFIGRQAK